MGGDRCEIFSWGNMTGWNLIAILREQASKIVDPSIVQVQKHLDIELITDYSLAAEDPKKIVNNVVNWPSQRAAALSFPPLADLGALPRPKNHTLHVNMCHQVFRNLHQWSLQDQFISASNAPHCLKEKVGEVPSELHGCSYLSHKALCSGLKVSSAPMSRFSRC